MDNSSDFSNEDIVIPPFADERNRKLAAEISKKRLDLQRLIAQTAEQDSRKKAMEEHLESIKHEIIQGQSLYDLKAREIETEKHLFQLADREHGQLKLAIKKLDNDMEELTSDVTELQGFIYQGSEKIEALKVELNMTKAEWETWQKANKEKEDDHSALEKYSKDDAKRLTDLTLKIQRLTHEVSKKKHELTKQLTDAQLARIEVEKTTEQFREVHKERQELIQQWEGSLKQVIKRDTDIEEAKNELIQLESTVQEKRVVLAQKRQAGEQLEEEIHNIEKAISSLERVVAVRVTDAHQKRAELNEFKIEVDALRTSLANAESSLRNQKSMNLEYEKALEQKKAQVERLKAKKEAASEKLKQIQNQTLTAQQKNAELEKMVVEEQARKLKLEKSIKEAKDADLKKKKTFHELKDQEKQLKLNIQSSESSLKSIRSSNARLEQHTNSFEAVLYNHSFEVQQMERKIRRAKGERSAEETSALHERIKQLEVVLNEWGKKVSMVSQEYKQSVQDVRKSKRLVEHLQVDRERLDGELAEITLHIELAESQLARTVSEKEDLVVEESLLKLELRKLSAVFNDKTTALVSAEVRQEQLRAAIEERIKEIEAHKEVLRMHLKVAEEERASIAADLRHRMQKVDKIKCKYEVIMMGLNRPEDEGQEISQAYYIIKAAKKKEDLKQETVEVQKDLSKVEAEVKMLEETLFNLQSQNDSLRKYLKQRSINVEDEEEKKKLQQRMEELTRVFKEKKQVLADIEQEILVLEGKQDEITETINQEEQVLKYLQAESTKLDGELADQETKKARALSQAEKSSSQYRQSRASEDPSVEELDIQIREQKNLNRKLYEELSERVTGNTSFESVFQTLCLKKGINPPSRAASVASSVSSRPSSKMSQGNKTGLKQPKSITIGMGLDEALNMQPLSKKSQAESGWIPRSPTKSTSRRK